MWEKIAIWVSRMHFDEDLGDFSFFFLSFFFFLGELVFLHVHFRWKMGKIKLVLASIPNLLLFSEKGFCWAGDFILFIFFNLVKNFKISPCGWSRFSFLLFF